MDEIVLQSQVEHLKLHGEMVIERYLDPTLKLELYRLEDSYYQIRYEQQVMFRPVEVHQLTEEQVREWL